MQFQVVASRRTYGEDSILPFSRTEGEIGKVGLDCGGMIQMRAAQRGPLSSLSCGRSAGKILAVDPYQKVRLACSECMTQREASLHFNILHDPVAKIIARATPPDICALKALYIMGAFFATLWTSVTA